MCLLLGAAGVGKTLLVKRLQKLSAHDGKGDLGDPWGEVVVSDLVCRVSLVDMQERAHYVEAVLDASDPTQLSASCAHLLALLSAEQLAEASVLILFNKTDLPCYMSVEEMKSLMRLPDIVACAKQNITTVEVSAREGTGLAGVLHWLQDTHRASC
ncbi:ADP-ribosylation factor-like protein 16 [Echinops telfairi]|uniref:ADP-ribosylation factor-like protein 16 n=1 Tax=Echinops telfairi TaxID=9371 RepID=A0AC55DUN6_ECHTE|nr:ADP-ribosylation factor-like protein 16 [Echinops telfairi]